MIEILKFIFSSFWVFVGTVIILGCITNIITAFSKFFHK